MDIKTTFDNLRKTIGDDLSAKHPEIMVGIDLGEQLFTTLQQIADAAKRQADATDRISRTK